MVFGDLADAGAGVVVTDADGRPIGYAQSVGYFAFFVLPTIIFFSALTAIALPPRHHAVRRAGPGVGDAKTTGTSGAETLSTAANIFVGQTEAPLMVRPFLADVHALAS